MTLTEDQSHISLLYNTLHEHAVIKQTPPPQVSGLCADMQPEHTFGIKFYLQDTHALSYYVYTHVVCTLHISTYITYTQYTN